MSGGLLTFFGCVWCLQNDDIRILRDIEQYYATQIDEMPMNVADLI